jgi:hypothetical protein
MPAELSTLLRPLLPEGSMPVRKGKDAQRQTAYLSPLGGAHSDDYRAMQAARCDLIQSPWSSAELVRLSEKCAMHSYASLCPKNH